MHVGIIMDGNGRWASSKGLPRSYGHKKGADVVRATVEAAADLGIKHLTLYGFSEENWARPQDEVGTLMGLAERYLSKYLDELHQKNVKFSVIGNKSRLPESLQKKIEKAENLTAENDLFYLNIALSYASRDEITQAVRSIASKVKMGEFSVSEIDEALVSQFLFSPQTPDLDLVIRTSGEQRLSNFMLWQAAYAELYFTEVSWPEFTRTDLEKAIEWFNGRERRFGHVKSEV